MMHGFSLWWFRAGSQEIWHAGRLLSPTQSLCVLSAARSEAELVFGGRRGPAGAAAGLKSVQLQRLSSGVERY